MAVKTSKDISAELYKQSKAAQDNPREIFGIANFGDSWPKLNHLTRGLQDKSNTVLAARPKVGKSTLISQFIPDFAIQARDAGKVLRIVTLETTMTTYLQRTAAQLAGIKDPLRIRAGSLDKDERRNYTLALQTLRDLPIEFLSNEFDLSERESFQPGFSGIGMSHIEEFVRQDDTFLWVVDHAGLINRQGQGVGSTQQLEAIANKLNYIANRYVGGITITHLNRMSLDGGMPSFENLAGTDAFGKNAGQLYFLWRPFFESRNRTPEDIETMKALGGDPGLIVFRSRNEGNGSVGIFWNEKFAAFEESDMREEDLPRPGGGGRRR